VLLLDRATFPRDKPCGDLLGVRAVRIARELGLDEDVLAPFGVLSGALVTTSRGALDLVPKGSLGRSLLRHADARIVPRQVFDAGMVDAAVRAGAELRQGTVRSIRRWNGEERSIEGVVGGESFNVRARAVVLAGGYGSAVLVDGLVDMDELPRNHQSQRGIAMRGYFGGVTAPPDRIVFCLDDWMLPGYGWVFPLPNGAANVGVGTLVRDGAEREHLRALYRRFVADVESPVASWLRGSVEVGVGRSWPLDLGPRRRQLVHDGLVLAGEAAGFVGPLTGAGIAFALVSGKLAGAAVARALRVGSADRPQLLPYQRSVRRRFQLWLRTEAAAQRWLSDPCHVHELVKLTRPLPMTGVIGASLLLHLG
jgi:flavin-dependent dehydrogenase